ncbi:MAG: outer membrane beta-barrel protein [Desulfobacterales bacterium]
MKKIAVALVLCAALGVAFAWTEHSQAAEGPDLMHDVMDLNKRVTTLEQKSRPHETPVDQLLQSTVSGLQLGGGISAGFFYASNPGKNLSDNEFLLSNFLVQLSSKDSDLPVGVVGAFGETSTPSLLSTPENNTHFDIEYASLILKPIPGGSLDMGLLQPNAGFESTYTFNNINVLLGAIASQQPYNAYGVRLDYDIHGFRLRGGYYKKRLDPEEYNDNGSSPGDSWEIGVRGSVLNNKFSIYHYHVEAERNLTGVVIERTVKNVYLALNIDYWNRDAGTSYLYKNRSSIGGALYIAPRFGHFLIPLRLEYIDQGESRIYIDNANAKHIYAATISPTYTFREKAYIRVESAYVHAGHEFADKNGDIKHSRIWLAAEIGYLF